MLVASQTNEPADYELDDEFGDYMEQSLMQEADSLGIFDPRAQEAAASKELEIYEKALLKVKEEVSKVPQSTTEEETKQINTVTSKPKGQKSDNMTEIDE